jgi:hypothetical protein
MEQKSTIQRSKKQSKEIIDLKISLNITRDFLCLVQLLDTLPNTKRVPYDVTRSLYQAVSKGRDMHTLGKELEGFFGPPIKPAGQLPPSNICRVSAMNRRYIQEKPKTDFIMGPYGHGIKKPKI